MSDFERMIDNFFNKYLIVQRGLSEHTRKTYRDCFVELFEYIKSSKKINPDKIEIDNLDLNTINAFLDYLEETKNVSASTRNNRLAAIKSFFKYVMYHKPKYLSLCSLILSIKQKKTESKPMNYLTIKAYKFLLSIFNKDNKKELRDLCIISLLYESGARVSELINIRKLEIRLSSPSTLVLHGKGNKTRLVPIDLAISKLLSRYIDIYKVKDDDWLFFNSRREKLTREGVNFLLQKYFNKAKEQEPELFPSTISPHCLRHSKAMHLLENGVELIYIRDLLGHASVTTTEIYSKVNPEIKRKHIEEATKELIGDDKDYSDIEESKLLTWLKTMI